MSIVESVTRSLVQTFHVAEVSDGTRVTTHCIYPSHCFVQVIIRGGIDSFVVSDEGGALREIEAAGAEIDKPDRLLRHLVTDHGLEISNGVIHSPHVTRELIGLAVALVANASRDVADWLFAHTKIDRQRNFKALVKQFLEVRFADRVRHETFVGQSNKPHRFDHLVRLQDGKRIIVDPVLHDASSINARVVAHMDVRMAKHDNLEQRLIYDDEDAWTAEDLNLLQVGAPIVMPFSKASNVLGRMAATN